MDTASLTEESLIEILLDSLKRAELVSAIQAETGFNLPLTNRYHEVAPRCKATPEQLERAVNALLQYALHGDLLIDPLVFHPRISEKVLFDLYHRERCLSSLGHRSGPRLLLEKLAEEHAFSEAITTLALDYYGAPDADEEEFVDFINKHRGDPMLRWNLENSTNLSEKKRIVALSLIRKDAHKGVKKL